MLIRSALWAGLSCLPIIVIPGACVTGLGLWSTPIDVMVIAIAGMIILGLILGLPMIVFKRTRKDGLVCLTYSFLLLLFAYPSILIGGKLRTYGFYLAAGRAEPLIVAIESYKKENGDLPPSLDALKPKYIKHMPYGIPPLDYRVHDNGVWELSANASGGVLNWDVFYYLSDQKYEGSSVERIGDWAYFHE